MDEIIERAATTSGQVGLRALPERVELAALSIGFDLIVPHFFAQLVHELPVVGRWQRMDLSQDFSGTHVGEVTQSSRKAKHAFTVLRRGRRGLDAGEERHGFAELVAVLQPTPNRIRELELTRQLPIRV